MTTKSITLPEWITREMDANAWGTPELAHRTGLEVAVINRVLRGEEYDRAAVWPRLAQAFGVPEATIAELAERKQSLAEWLRVETARRRWSYREVARQSGYSNTAISGIANGDNTTPEVCRALARVFGVPPEDVMRLAGILPEHSAVLPVAMEWSDWLRELMPGLQAQTIAAVNQIFAIVRLPRPDPGPGQTGPTPDSAVAQTGG